MRLATLLLFAAPVWAAGYQAEILRDEYGVPHIYGKTDADVTFGLAYAQAEDNFWQLEEDYIRALGRAAEMNGVRGLAGDIHYRLWRVEERAKKAYASASPDLRSMCDAFAAGYNAYLKKHPEKARLLTRMEGWHVLAFQDGSPSLYAGGVRREDVAREFPMLATVPLETEAGEDEDGSNMWAVSPKKSASGKAMLFLNPHVGFFGGGQRFEAQLESKQGLRVNGFAILGTPYIRSGFTASYGWCHTNNNADIVDVYRETFDRAGDPMAYRYGTAYRQAESWTAEIPVRKGDAIEKAVVKMRRTHHGPISGVRDGHPLATRGVDRTPLDLMRQRVAMAKAKSLPDFQKVMSQRAITGSNTMYADAKGNIFYLHGNAIPKRDGSRDWARDVDGADPKTEWEGLHAFADLPQFVNPASGYLQNCNSNPSFAAGDPGTGATWPAYFVPELDNFRSKRSRQVLTSRERFTFEEWSDAALDTGIYLAGREQENLRKLWPAWAQANPERGAKLKEAVEMFLAWDGRSTVESVPMALFMAAFLSRGRGNDNEAFLTPELFAKAASGLEKDFGKWRVGWGEINRMQRVHTSGRQEPFSDTRASFGVPGAPGTVGVVFNFYASQPRNQKKLYGTRGNTYVAVVEFGKRLRAGSQLVFGQSADPKSPHHLDQAPLYSGRRFKTVHYYADDVRKNLRGRVTVNSE
ncbi:MAG: penicillin acylase family protein [Acidobacteria bacterium]|nr:penicillin acylase family protein [Acidobacteriota bacterium]